MTENYREVTEYICKCRRFGKACGKEVSEGFFDLLGYEKPANMHIFHVAGTNGKGSTVAFMNSILREMNYLPGTKEERRPLVGMFTSPHLVSFTERIVVDGQQISEEDVARIGSFLVEKAKELKNAPTMFDYCLVMAMIYFKEKGCDYVILETGLGGELDSTNAEILQPEMAIITSIGLEHTEVLGTNIKTIARAKAGIIKPKQLVVYGELPAEAEAVIFARAMAYGIFAKKSGPVSEKRELSLFVAYQRKNAGLAETALREYFENRLTLDDIQKADFEAAIEAGMKKAHWPGRMEIVSIDQCCLQRVQDGGVGENREQVVQSFGEKPFIMLDGAHNPQGVEALRDSLMEAFPGEKFGFVVGVMADKDYRAMMRRLKDLADCFYTVTVENSRALAANELAEALVEAGNRAVACDNLEDALQKALAAGKKTIVCGSLYFIGQVKSLFIDNIDH